MADGEDSVDGGRGGGGDDEGVAAMAGNGSGKRRGGDGEDGREHGEDTRVGDTLIDAEADGECAASG